MAEIYFDNSATTRICDEALDEYVRISREIYGNPSSRHALGFRAEEALNGARRDVLASLGAKDGKIIFTSGGTEGNNLAITGRAHAKERFRGGRIITTEGEHSSVSHTLNALKNEGYDIQTVPTANGNFDTNAFLALLTPRTVLVSVMAVNNETGAVYPLEEIADAVHRLAPEALFHVDATQSYMKIPFMSIGFASSVSYIEKKQVGGSPSYYITDMGFLGVSETRTVLSSATEMEYDGETFTIILSSGKKYKVKKNSEAGKIVSELFFG